MVERKNQVLQGMARVMLHMNDTAILPIRLSLDLEPNLKYFRTFGSECNILRDGENLGKFDSNSNLGIFLGYSNKSKAYRVYNQSSKVIQKSSNVVVNDFWYA